MGKRYFAKKLGKHLDKSEIAIEADDLEALKSYSWPGNIRELQNTIERALNLLTDTTVKLEHLPQNITGSLPPKASFECSGTSIKEVEMNIIINILQKHGGNRKRAAEN